MGFIGAAKLCKGMADCSKKLMKCCSSNAVTVGDTWRHFFLINERNVKTSLAS